jgi:hypothetical protein|tara:strand:+ start:339 stop:491 length:153 start_codon:yes stop_codon:yes gene_type:complete
LLLLNINKLSKKRNEKIVIKKENATSPNVNEKLKKDGEKEIKQPKKFENF